MVIFDIKLINLENFIELHAKVKCDTHWVWGDDPFSLWYRYPVEYEPFLSIENGDPFVAAFLAPAMVLREPLEIQAPVSEKLFQAIPKIQTIYRCWNKQLSEIVVKASCRKKPTHKNTSKNIGLFFSLGVDSTYSLQKNLKMYPNDDKVITHLINVSGFDIDVWETKIYSMVLNNIIKVAKGVGKTALPTETNLRDFSDRVVDWPRLYHGPALASVGLALRSMFRKIIIAASTTYDLLYPWGSHPLLDPLWSTEDVLFVHDGCEAGRLEKIQRISTWDLAMDTLRVCAADLADELYNCCKCEKCIKTSVALYAINSLQQCKTFKNNLDIDLIKKIVLETPLQKAFFKEIIAVLGSSKRDLSIKSALKESLIRSRERVSNNK